VTWVHVITGKVGQSLLDHNVYTAVSPDSPLNWEEGFQQHWNGIHNIVDPCVY
jgi:hypothetical protein